MTSEGEPVSLSRLETGPQALFLSTLASISEALQVVLDDLLDPESERPEPSLGSQETELLRLFEGIVPDRRKMLLKLARELSS